MSSSESRSNLASELGTDPLEQELKEGPIWILTELSGPAIV